MEQVNLLTMILATPAMGQAQLAPKATAGLPGAHFELALQRQLRQGGMPASALGDAGTAATSQALLADPQAAVDGGTPATLQGLLNALASSLLAVLGLDGKQSQSAAQQGGNLAWPAVDPATIGLTPAADSGQALASSLAAILDAGSGQGQPAASAGDAVWANVGTTGASAAQAPMARLLNLWPQLVQQLQTLLQSATAGELKAQLSWPSANQATASATATPWSMAVVDW